MTKYEELIERLSPKLKAIAHKLDGRFTLINDDDLYQQALLYLWTQYQKDNLDDKTDSFIVQGCVYSLKNYIRTVHKKVDRNSKSLQDHIDIDECEMQYSLSLAEESDSYGKIEGDLIKEDIISRLNQREQDVVAMVLEGWTTREIGKRLGTSHVMVVKIKKIIRKKCKILKDEIYRNRV